MKRQDDFKKRSEHLKNLTDEQIDNRFWSLAEKIVQPMLDLGYCNTTPAIERSILLRMGFSSIEIKPIVEGVMKKGLMGKGCGNVVWRLSQKKGISIRAAGLALCEEKYWDDVDDLFEKKGR
ncbi:ornithine aminomutase subunit alpha [Petroclostridium sp. X23]|uniref:ornithine aminomutase subunit alpha n=1 Tax=Petroclostridium sp. X23 TaxID=3045146 RepID=UPI0024AE3502|nr:ornithine aminomutase subunit alpha [Petroclostridium sp. X23]WHH61243.1 ornithine aminomutase subunit alpha [Petroclostridium sp. X23]